MKTSCNTSYRLFRIIGVLFLLIKNLYESKLIQKFRSFDL